MTQMMQHKNCLKYWCFPILDLSATITVLFWGLITAVRCVLVSSIYGPK